MLSKEQKLKRDLLGLLFGSYKEAEVGLGLYDTALKHGHLPEVWETVDEFFDLLIAERDTGLKATINNIRVLRAVKMFLERGDIEDAKEHIDQSINLMMKRYVGPLQKLKGMSNES